MGNSKVLLVIAGLIAVASLGAALYFYQQYQAFYNQSPAAAQAEADRIVSLVSRLIVLPANEKPTIAVVSDASKLSDQPFFANAKNGDRVLIYSAAKKAILYRESENKIIEVAPITIGAAAPAPAAAPTTPETSTKK